jgi:peptidoglycan/xylan/chitin deacetylase (PgdA/CDA1 family)
VEPWTIGVPGVFALGASISAWGAFTPSSQLLGPVLWRLPVEPPRRIGLTFDDGPNPAITPRLLALLERYNARSTFFIIGQYAEKCPDLVREIAARGHLIGNHTHTHPDLIWLSRARIAQELRQCEEAVAAALAATKSNSFSQAAPPRDVAGGVSTLMMAWMRPPFGFRGPQLYGVTSAMGFRGVATWSRRSYDWKPQRPERLIARLGRVRARDIVLMHDGDHRALGGDRAHVVAALEHWLPRWRDAGLEFVTIAP